MIETLVVEDEKLVGELHSEYVQRMEGFEPVGVARSGQETLQLVRSLKPDLLLLDMNLPDMHGLEVCRILRSAGVHVDVIAVTAARDLEMVREAVSLGVVQYVIKPFSWATFREKLLAYAAYRQKFSAHSDVATQSELDSIISLLRSPDAHHLPKGLTAGTLGEIVAALRRNPEGLAASDAADAAKISRVTARRYLEYLADYGRVRRSAVYAGPGRPQIRYVLESS